MKSTEIRTIAAGLLRIHPTAQRSLTPAKLREIRKTIDLDAIGVLHAVEYAIDGVSALWVIDGHHRLTVLLELGMGEWPVDVVVHLTVTTDARASDLFLKLNNRTLSRPDDTFRNELQAKYDDAVAISSIVEGHGLRIDVGSIDGSVRCVSALKRAYAIDDGPALDAALGALVSAWGRVQPAFEGRIVEGFARFHAAYGGAIDKASLTSRLKKYPGGPLVLLGRAKGLSQMNGRTLTKCIVEVLVEVYDKGRSTGRLAA